MKVEPRTLPGFMELLPKEQILFNKMKEKIQKKEEKMIKENKRNNASCTGSNNNNTCNISYHKYKHSI